MENLVGTFDRTVGSFAGSWKEDDNVEYLDANNHGVGDDEDDAYGDFAKTHLIMTYPYL